MSSALTVTWTVHAVPALPLAAHVKTVPSVALGSVGQSTWKVSLVCWPAQVAICDSRTAASSTETDNVITRRTTKKINISDDTTRPKIDSRFFVGRRIAMTRPMIASTNAARTMTMFTSPSRRASCVAWSMATSPPG